MARPSDGQVLVRVDECGLCGSDVKLFSGKHPVVKPPMVLGHEFHGVVEARGPDADGPEPGERVAVFPPIGCGRCYNCRRGQPHLCPQMSFVGGEHQGGLSEVVAVPAANAVPMLPGVPADLRVLVEPLAVGVHAAARAGAVPEDKVLVIGAGPIGFSRRWRCATAAWTPTIVLCRPVRRPPRARAGPRRRPHGQHA